MKKLVSTLLALVMVIGLVGCKSNEVQKAISENSGKEPTYFEEFPDLPTPEIFTLGKISGNDHTYIYELSKDEEDSDLGRVAYCSRISTTGYTLEKTDDTYKNFTVSNSGGVIAHISMYKDDSLGKYVLEVKIDKKAAETIRAAVENNITMIDLKIGIYNSESTLYDVNMVLNPAKANSHRVSADDAMNDIKNYAKELKEMGLNGKEQAYVDDYMDKSGLAELGVW